jgi:hypothetical protein
MFVLDQSFKAAVGLAANAASGDDACCGATSAAQQRRVDGGERNATPSQTAID